MSKTAIVFGALLIALGLGGYFAGETRSWTAVIPAIFGLVILGLGITALWEAYRASAMHAAVIVGLLGFFATATSLVDLVRMLSDQRPCWPRPRWHCSARCLWRCRSSRLSTRAAATAGRSRTEASASA